jgi:hypothetical protein
MFSLGSYVERDRSRADDYYLGEGSGDAERFAATPDGVGGGRNCGLCADYGRFLSVNQR